VPLQTNFYKFFFYFLRAGRARRLPTGTGRQSATGLSLQATPCCFSLMAWAFHYYPCPSFGQAGQPDRQPHSFAFLFVSYGHSLISVTCPQCLTSPILFSSHATRYHFINKRVKNSLFIPPTAISNFFYFLSCSNLLTINGESVVV
jgi:hypothetical protein